ncbi:MAG: M1 family metallopeptidase [Burkholderiales bacterium]
MPHKRLFWLPIFFQIIFIAGCAQFARTSPATPPVLRLGDSVTPLRYAARLVVDPARDDFDGEISIDVRINIPAKIIWLNATEIKISAAKIELQSAAAGMVLKPLSGGNDFVGLQADSILPAGDARITIQYSGRLEPLATYGLFKQKSGNDFYVVSQFEAYDARRAFPCFDEPGWKTPWQITLDVPKDLVAVSNTPQKSEQALPGSWKRIGFAQTPPLPAYLIAVAIGPFDVVDGGTAGMNQTPLRYLTPKGRAAEARYATENTPRVLELLENYFGSAYPYEKLDSVTIPQTVGFGAMENVSMITYAGNLLLAKTHEESDNFKQRYISTAAHEIAHQWFGNLVTMKWWNDVWLNEAFATWLGDSKITHAFKPEWDDGWSRAQQRQRAIDSDRMASTRRVRNPVGTKDDIWAAFDSITYQKGGAVLEMFESGMTPQRFRDGVRLHMKNHANGNADMEDFVGALSAASDDANLVAAFTGFIEQPGVPLIDVALDCAAAPAIVLQQSRLKPAGSKIDARENWITPACFSFGFNGKVEKQCTNVANGASRVLLSNAKSCPDWVMGNAQGAGYYVTRYDNDARERLNRNASRLPAPEAIALLSDAALMTESGLQSVDESLRQVAMGFAHSDVVVQQAALELLKDIREPWLIPAQRPTFRQLLQEHVIPLANRLSWLDQPGDNERVRRLREVALPMAAEQGADSGLRGEALKLARAWLAKRDAVSSGMVEAVLETAGQFADADLIDAMTRELMTTDDTGDRRKLLSALARVRDPLLRERVLALALNGNINGREAQNFLQDALQDDHNRVPAFAFVQKNFDSLVAKLPQHRIAQFMEGLERSCSKQERDRFVDFFNRRHHKFQGGPLIYTQALEKIDLCIAARARNENDFKLAGIE